jgi:hypothetical protein
MQLGFSPRPAFTEQSMGNIFATAHNGFISRQRTQFVTKSKGRIEPANELHLAVARRS